MRVDIGQARRHRLRPAPECSRGQVTPLWGMADASRLLHMRLQLPHTQANPLAGGLTHRWNRVRSLVVQASLDYVKHRHRNDDIASTFGDGY